MYIAGTSNAQLNGSSLGNSLPVSSGSGKTGETKAETEDDARLQKVCQDFESIFLSMIWKEMMKSTGQDLGGWDVLAEQAMGEQWARAGGIGLAKVMYRAMSKHLSDARD